MKVQNTLSRSLEEIKPLQDNKIKLYTCGLTVYSQPHIGNWVAYIYWDILVRTLRDAGYDVTHVQNITDVGHLTSDEDAGEDKMLKGALSEGLTAWQVAEKYIKIADDEAYAQLGLTRPNHMPRATEYIPQQIAFVEELEQKGYTYVIADGVYFDTSKLVNYGELARLDIEGLQFGARVADTGKKNPTDFAVWKFSDPAEKRDMEWDSPWGKGFPGWHLECSVMSRALLGDQIDIHAGGIDHIPVHHSNEIAQTEAITGKPFSTYWLHNNHLKVDGEKMSKSLGNIYTIKDIRDKGFDLEAFKLTILSKHYRTEGNFTWDIIEASQNRLNGYRAMADNVWQPSEQGTVDDAQINATQVAIRQALQDDLNTPQALRALSQFESAIDSNGLAEHSQGAYTAFLEWIDGVLGLTLSKRADISSEQKTLIKERQEARDDKNWEISDRLRDQLLEQGIEIKDTPRGQIWFKTD
jgi:cysteinyl-tRNA synthetase